MYATPTMNLGAGPVVIAAPRSFDAGSGKRRRSDAPPYSPRAGVPVAAAAPLSTAGLGLQSGSVQQMGMHIDPPPSKRVRTRSRAPAVSMDHTAAVAAAVFRGTGAPAAGSALLHKAHLSTPPGITTPSPRWGSPHLGTGAPFAVTDAGTAQFWYTPPTPVTSGLLGYGTTVGMTTPVPHGPGGTGAKCPIMQQLAQTRLERSERYREQQARRTFTPGRQRKRPVTDRPCNGDDGDGDGTGDGDGEDHAMSFTPPEKRRHIAAPAILNVGTNTSILDHRQGLGGQQNQMSTWRAHPP